MVFKRLVFRVEMELDRCDDHSIIKSPKSNFMFGFRKILIKFTLDYAQVHCHHYA